MRLTASVGVAWVGAGSQARAAKLAAALAAIEW